MFHPVSVSVNARYSHSNLALLYLKAALKGECRIIEWDINRSRRDLLEELTGQDYSHYLFSVYIWNAEYLNTVIQDLRTVNPDAVICCGGPEAVYNGDRWRSIPGIDFILDGNAEDFPEILPELKPKKPPEPAEIIRVSPKPFSETVFPYDAEMLKALEGRLLYYEASRGCSFNCSYCLSAASDNVPEYRTEEQIKTEIKLLSRFNGTVKFVDRTFNYNKTISRLIWQTIIDNPPAGCFHFEIHPVLLEEEDLRLLSLIPPGKARLEIGIQSTDPRVMKNINRTDSWEKSKGKILRLISMEGLHIHLDQIIGLPGDSPETAAETMNRILELRPDVFQPGFLKILHGTPLEKEKECFGINASVLPPYEILNSTGFSFADLQYFHRLEDLISILYNSGFFRLSLFRLSESLGSWTGLLDAVLTGKGAESPADTEIKRWEYWGERLFKLTETMLPGELPNLIDLLRLDWCPFANAQRYPAFIEYNNISGMNALKKDACRIVAEQHPEIPKSSLKRSILFIPESESLEPLRKQLFVRHQKKVISMSLF